MEEGILCVKCVRWYHFDCMPDSREAGESMEEYVCSIHNEERAGKKPAESNQNQDPNQKLNPEKEGTETSVLEKDLPKQTGKKEEALNQMKQKIKEANKEAKGMQKTIKELAEEKKQAEEKSCETENLYKEAKEIIDEKIEKGKLLEEENGMLREEISRLKLKNAFYQTNWKLGEETNNEAESNKHDQSESRTRG